MIGMGADACPSATVITVDPSERNTSTSSQGLRRGVVSHATQLQRQHGTCGAAPLTKPRRWSLSFPWSIVGRRKNGVGVCGLPTRPPVGCPADADRSRGIPHIWTVTVWSSCASPALPLIPTGLLGCVTVIMGLPACHDGKRLADCRGAVARFWMPRLARNGAR